MKKPLPKFWYCDVWKENFWFFIGWKKEDFISWIKKHSGHDIYIGEQAAGHTSWVSDSKGSRVCIWIKKKGGVQFHEILAHEAVHAANFVLGPRGAKLDFENDEMQAYLVGAIVRKAMQ